MTDDQVQPFDSTAKLSERLDINLALKVAQLGVWELDPITNQINWDDRCRELFGLAKNNRLPYEQAIRHIHPEDVDRVDQTVRWAMNAQSGGEYDVTYRTIGADDGLLRWVRFIGQAYFNETSEVYRFTGVAQDVTHVIWRPEEVALQTLVESEERFRTIIEQAPVAMALFSGPQFVITLANERVLEYWGRTRKQVMNKPLFEALPEASGQGFEELLQGVYSTGERFVARELAVNLERNGQIERTYIDFVYEPFYQTSDTITGVTVSCVEITEQVLARQRVAESEAKFRSLVEEAPVATCLFVGREMTIEVANDTMISYWGKDQSVIGKPLIEAVPELKDQPFLHILDEVFTTGQPYEARNARAELAVDGELGTYYFDFIYKPLRNAAGNIYAVMDSAVDVTEQVVARQQLEVSEARFRSLVEEAPVATCLFVGREMTIEVANEAMITVWAKGPSVIGMPLAEALPELKGQSFLPLLDDLFTTGNTYSAKAGRADLVVDGELKTYFFDYIFKPLRNAAGEVYAILETAVDVTEQLVARQQLEASEARYRNLSTELEQQVQLRTEELATINEELMATNEELETHNEEYAAINEKLEEANGLLSRSNENLQQFAYIASHDLQEPLRKIQQFGDILKTQYTDQLGEGVDYLERMRSAASRMSILIRDLLSFSRISIQRDTSTPVSLTEVVNTILTDLDLRIQETNATLRVDHLPTVLGDSLQLEQLFHNLLSNALKFRRTDQAGVPVPPLIQVSAGLVTASDLPPSITPARWTSAYHKINVSDNGIGFEEKYVDRIFQVFQRLHGRNEFAGTGIGLAICEKVATNHGGAITASSQPRQGSTFSVYLPL